MLSQHIEQLRLIIPQVLKQTKKLNRISRLPQQKKALME
jgi:hypothetical protein